MRKVALLALLTCLGPQLVPQFARAQAAPAQGAPSAAPAPTAQAGPAPVAPPAPAGAFPQAPPPAPADVAPPPVAAPYPYGGGYGYGYAQPPMDPQRQKTMGELRTVDLRIASVRREQSQYSLAGPIAMTAAGFGTAIAFGVVAMVEWFIADDIDKKNCGYYYSDYNGYDSRCDVNNDGRVNSDDEHRARVLARTFGAMSGVGAAVGITGTVFLMKSMAKRRQYSPELNELSTRRGQLLQQLRYGGGYSNNGMQFTLSGRF